MSWLILPFYRVGVTAKIKIQRIGIPARGAALFLVGNRYLFHAVLGIATLTTLTLNLQARQAHAQDVGQNSLLYALATGSDVEIVSETARETPGGPTASYLGAGTLVAMPHVDFDYDQIDQPIASLTVPGSISAPTEPGTAVATQRAPRTTVLTYTVKEGDTLGSIANDFDVNVGTLLWNNNLSERQYIRPGDALKVPPVSGILATIKKGDTISKLANRYTGDAEEIKAFNNLADDSLLALGSEVMIPGGKPPEATQTLIAIIGNQQKGTSASRPGTSPVTYLSSGPGEPTQVATVSQERFGRGDSLSQLLSNIPKPNDVDASNLAKNKLLWPTSGHLITQYYGWKHTGVDIDGDFSSPLIAAYDGVVDKAGWNTGGYGLQIMIKHPNGMETRYAHSSKIFVKVGDQVKRGQVIAMMGSTGRSTGSHLHFELYVNGVRSNPLAYLR